jgi:two-component system, OmpR family, phosphate regulon sensor histidine kinase PhoR
VVNAEPPDRARELVADSGQPVVVLDSERRIVAASPAALELLPAVHDGSRLGEEALALQPGVLVLFLDSPPELSAYQELRAGFTAAVSHELRTPLARLLALLEGATLPGADIDDVLEQARAEVQQAGELIDDVLFLGELETGREVVSLGRTRARPVVDDVLASLRERADHAGVTIEDRVDDAVELPLRPRMLRVVLENLLANSIRYAGPGTTCRLEVSRAGEEAVVAVTDDGKGVPTADLPRLFERFYRSDQARTSRGTGLGLAIVKHVVTSAGGEVAAFGTPGEGLAIRARLPLA